MRISSASMLSGELESADSAWVRSPELPTHLTFVAASAESAIAMQPIRKNVTAFIGDLKVGYMRSHERYEQVFCSSFQRRLGFQQRSWSSNLFSRLQKNWIPAFAGMTAYSEVPIRKC